MFACHYDPESSSLGRRRNHLLLFCKCWHSFWWPFHQKSCREQKSPLWLRNTNYTKEPPMDRCVWLRRTWKHASSTLTGSYHVNTLRSLSGVSEPEPHRYRPYKREARLDFRSRASLLLPSDPGSHCYCRLHRNNSEDSSGRFDSQVQKYLDNDTVFNFSPVYTGLNGFKVKIIKMWLKCRLSACI